DSGDVVVRALVNYTGSVYPLGGGDSYDTTKGAHVSSTTVSASLLEAVGLTTITAEDDSSAAAFIAGGGTVSAPSGTVVVAARAPHTVNPHQDTLSASFAVDFAGIDAEAKTGGTVAAYVDDGATIANTNSLSVTAASVNSTSVTANSVGLG